jgi:adenylate cyclase class 2
MHYEVEQKYPIGDAPRIEAALVKLGARIGPPQEEVDTYFNHPNRDFAQTDEALRIRRIGPVNCVTYKGPKLDTTTKTREELELPLPPGEQSAAGWSELFERLGFRRVMEVRKTRRPMTIPWEGAEVAGTLDQIDGLGTFLELEICTGADGLDEARATIGRLAAELGVVESERRSYLELLLGK